MGHLDLVLENQLLAAHRLGGQHSQGYSAIWIDRLAAEGLLEVLLQVAYPFGGLHKLFLEFQPLLIVPENFWEPAAGVGAAGPAEHMAVGAPPH